MTQESSSPHEIDPKLAEHIQALRAITSIHSLLNLGCFQYGARDQIAQGIAFMATLHAQLKAEVLAHPDCDKVPELKALKPVEETKDGSAPSTVASEEAGGKETSPPKSSS